jgi:hypothetical protein
MPFLKVVDTTLEPRAPSRRWSVRILASLGVALLAILAGGTTEAQTSPPAQQKPAEQKPRKGAKGLKGSRKKDAIVTPGTSGPDFPKGFPVPSTTPSPAPAGKKAHAKAAKDAKAPESTKAAAAPLSFPSASTTPPRAPVDRKENAKLAALRWNKITETLLRECLARDPARAFEQPWGGIAARHLGEFGSGATQRWRKTLTELLTELRRFATEGQHRQVRAQLRALDDRVESELLMLDAQTPSTSDPSGYVERAFRTLRAAREAAWMPPERRAVELENLRRELPAYFEDARQSLIDSSAAWIDLALQDLDDLQELVSAIERDLPAKPAPRTPKERQAVSSSDAAPLEALEGFGEWLLEQRPSAADRVWSLGAGEWQRLVSLTSGTDWTVSELKARCLRELARLDLGARVQPSPGTGMDACADLPALAASASARALELGKEAHVLRTRFGPEAAAFELETSPRTGAGIARVSVEDGDSARVFLAEPHGSWPPERTIGRSRNLRAGATALGVRYGLAGEALFGLQCRASKKTVGVLLDNRLLREGLGLYALDWPGRIARVENPFGGDEALALEFDRSKGHEAARLVAAIELHAEGLSLEDAAAAFERRTGVDRETARAEAQAAERDPLYGLAYLGLIELRALEERLTRLTGPRRGISLCLLFAARHPDLRPSDGILMASRRTSPKRRDKETGAMALENPARTQQELPRSR